MNTHHKKLILSLVWITASILLLRLFWLQVIDDRYRIAAENNIIHPVIEQPSRGEIYDRKGVLLTHDVAIYDLMVSQAFVHKSDLINIYRILNISEQEGDKRLNQARKQSNYRPSVFIRGLSQIQWAKVQDRLSIYKGFFVRSRTARYYPDNLLATTLGYTGEVTPQKIKEDNYYRPGDIFGISGLEAQYEKRLRGQKGISYEVVDVRGDYKGHFREGILDNPQKTGNPLHTTLDADLQKYLERLMQGKSGSIVALEPSTGAVLAMVSAPTYNPSILSGTKAYKKFSELRNYSGNPFFHRPTMACYSPGSIFKIPQALIALQEGVITPDTKFNCNRKLVNCHSHPAPLRLTGAIQHSCNPYFTQVFRRLMGTEYESIRRNLSSWSIYLRSMGLGEKLGIDLPNEKSGMIPDVSFYDKKYGARGWKVSTIRSLDIGQGELLVTPLQMANLCAILANRGNYYRPHLVKTVNKQNAILTSIAPENIEVLLQGMQDSVEHGTSWRARVPGITMCAKTGTVQNDHGFDHAVCIAFAPRTNPTIALSIYVENAGWGGRSAAAIAGLATEYYLTGKVTRPWMEKYVMEDLFR